MGTESVPCLFSIFDDISDLTESSWRGNGITNGAPFRAFGFHWRGGDLAGGPTAVLSSEPGSLAGRFFAPDPRTPCNNIYRDSNLFTFRWGN